MSLDSDEYDNCIKDKCIWQVMRGITNVMATSIALILRRVVITTQLANDVGIVYSKAVKKSLPLAHNYSAYLTVCALKWWWGFCFGTCLVPHGWNLVWSWYAVSGDWCAWPNIPELQVSPFLTPPCSLHTHLPPRAGWARDCVWQEPSLLGSLDFNKHKLFGGLWC